MIDFLNHWGRLWAEYFGMAVVQNTLFLALIFISLLTFLIHLNAPFKE